MGLNAKQLKPQVEAMAAHLAGDDGRVPLALVRPSRWQPREPVFDEDALWELAKSIAENGLINEIVVFPVAGGYELVAGERRSRAMAGLVLGEALENHTPKECVLRLANVGLSGLNDEEKWALAGTGATIPARIESAADLKRLHRLAVVENLERENLNPLEEARALAGLVEAYEWTQRDLARHLGKSQGWVAQRLALLELPAAAQEALNTRVINLTHARALQGVPEAVARALTEDVTRRVKQGATTREVDAFAQTVKTFLDEMRYEPDPERIYTAQMRNWLGLIRWLVKTGDWNVHAQDLIKLVKHDYLADMEVSTAWKLETVAELLGYDSLGDAWEAFAADTLRTCTQCGWNRWDWTGDEWQVLDSYADAPCKRWEDREAMTCQRYIGPADPEVVFLCYELRDGFGRLGIAYEKEPFSHVVGIAEFVENWRRLLEALSDWEAEKEEEQATAHIEKIQRYYKWQLSLPREATEHIQAHECFKCAHCVDGAKAGLCRFVQEPLLDRHGEPRPPQFGAFVTREGLMLPRCEMFTYRNRLPIKRVQGTVLPNHEQAVDWLVALAGTGANSCWKIWAILQWMDYGRQPGEVGREQELAQLADHLLATWELPASNFGEEMPTLLDVVASEASPKVGHTNIIELVNPVIGEREQFVPIDFELVLGERTWPGYREYPDGWPRPWLDLPAEEQDDAE